MSKELDKELYKCLCITLGFQTVILTTANPVNFKFLTVCFVLGFHIIFGFLWLNSIVPLFNKKGKTDDNNLQVPSKDDELSGSSVAK